MIRVDESHYFKMNRICVTEIGENSTVELWSGLGFV